MIPVRHYRGGKWHDAWLVQVIASPPSSQTCILAIAHDARGYQGDEPDTLALYVEPNLDQVRIKRTRIPL